MSVEAINVAITGAAGQIGYSLIPQILQRETGPFDRHDARPVNLRLFDLTDAMPRLEGVAMEAQDLASPNLAEVNITDDPKVAFDGVEFAFLVGSRPRGDGMDRADLLEANAPIFVEQGRALNDVADDDVRVLVVGNPANSNALVALSNAPDIPVDRFSAMSRLDQNRAEAMLARELGVTVEDIADLIIWGNHSDTMVVDIEHARLITPQDTSSIQERLQDSQWLEDFQQRVARRGAAVIGARGASSAASAANAAVDQAYDWTHGDGDTLHSMAVYSLGEYDVPEGLVFSYPCVTDEEGTFVDNDLELSLRVRLGIKRTAIELTQEREVLRNLGLLAVER